MILSGAHGGEQVQERHNTIIGIFDPRITRCLDACGPLRVLALRKTACIFSTTHAMIRALIMQHGQSIPTAASQLSVWPEFVSNSLLGSQGVSFECVNLT